MIVNRRTFIAKRGCLDAAAKMVVEELSKNDPPIPYRVYTANIAPFDSIAVEWEFEDLAAYEKAWTNWFARPETPEFMEKWNELTESGGKNEIWDLVV
jgi:hypothetical protein